jgi:hypothetical protein
MECPVDRYADLNTRDCVYYCPKTPVITFADPLTKICSNGCADNTLFADDSVPEGGKCVV